MRESFPGGWTELLHAHRGALLTVSFLTTFMRGDPARLSNLVAVTGRMRRDFPEAEIVVVEQGDAPVLRGDDFPGMTIRFVDNPQAFNKSWGMNVAYRCSTGDVLVVCDADILLDRDTLERTIQACATELDAARPYSRLIDMTREQAQAYCTSGELPAMPADGHGYDRTHAGESICFAGGVFVIRRAFYERLGGMDERFRGWGGEDDAMSQKLTRLGHRVAIARNALAWHLWHPRESRYDHDHYAGNVALLQSYRAMDDTALAGLCAVQREEMGNAGKHAARGGR